MIYQYEVHYFDFKIMGEQDPVIVQRKGIVSANTYFNAMKILTDYYGEEPLIYCSLASFDTNLIESGDLDWDS